jgi:hypothetical protein
MAEPTKRDILDQLLLLCEDMRAAFKRIDSRLDTIERRLDNLENASLQAPALAVVDDEAPSDEPSCEEQFCDDELSADEPSCDEPSDASCQIEPSCKPAYEPLRHRVKLSIRHQNKPSNRTQIKPPSLSQADDVVDTPCDSIIQGVIIVVDGVSLACWHRDVFTWVDRWRHRAGKQHGDITLGRVDPTTSVFLAFYTVF